MSAVAKHHPDPANPATRPACADLKLLTVERMCDVDDLNYWGQSFAYCGLTSCSAIRPMPTPSSTGLSTMPTASSCGATRCAAANRICLGMKRINQINNLQHLSTLLTQSTTDHNNH